MCQTKSTACACLGVVKQLGQERRVVQPGRPLLLVQALWRLYSLPHPHASHPHLMQPTPCTLASNTSKTHPRHLSGSRSRPFTSRMH